MGPYEVLDHIAQGGMGAVYRGRHRKSGVEVALKVLRAGERASPIQRERFKREVDALQRIQHENLLTVLDAGLSPSGSPWLAMPLIEGETLQERLGRHGPLPLDEVWELADQLSAGLGHVHRAGLIHRDLKPENLIRQEVSGLIRWVVTDFGLAKDLEVEESRVLSQSGAILGTPGYWAPEQAGARPGGPFTDVYGLGAVLYAALTGVPPIKAATFWETVVATENQTPKAPRQLRSETPPALERLILRCLEKDPAARFADASEVQAALALLEDGARTSSGRSGGLLLGALVCLSALAFGVAVALASSQPDNDSLTLREPSLSPSGPKALAPKGSASETPASLASRTPSPTTTPQGAADEVAALLRRALQLTVGDEVPQDLALAVELLERAARAGDPAATSELASLLVQRRGLEFDREVDERRALGWLDRGARRGWPRAIRGLGHLHYEGLGGTPKSPARARELYEIAAAKGDLDSTYSLLVFETEITPRAKALMDRVVTAARGGDPEGSYRLYLVYSNRALAEPAPGAALGWLEKAAEAGLPRALRDLGNELLAKESSPEVRARGLAALKRAASLGDRIAMKLWGLALARGEHGLVRDFKVGIDWVRRAAALGEPAAMRDHSLAITQGLFGEPDSERGFYWALQSALGGDPVAPFLVGSSYYKGQGVALDEAEGVRWFRAGAERGNWDAQHALAIAQLEGRGIRADPAAALKEFQALAKKGHAYSHLTLGTMRSEGRVLEQDDALARNHYLTAAKKGRVEAFLPLASFSLAGRGGEVDLRQARRWIEKAVEARQPRAREALRELERMEAR